MSANLKRNISEIVTPAADDISVGGTFISNMIHLKASDELIADLWCVGIKRSQATRGVTNQRGVRLAILPLARIYREDTVFSMRRLNARFVTDTLFQTLNH